MKVSRARASMTLGILASWSLLMIGCARRSDAIALDIIFGALLTVPLCSFWEWVVHAGLYHSRVPGFERIREIHQAGHHVSLFPPSRYVQSGPYEFMQIRPPLRPFRMSSTRFDNWLTSGSQIALHFAVGLGCIVAPAWWATHDLAFIVSCLITLSAISWLLAYVHGVIHTPRDRWIERRGWFKWLNHHHYVHHVDWSANVNFLLPLCDLLIGTKKPHV
jgi:hypothetical protein